MSLVVKVGSRFDLVSPVFHPFVQKAGFLTVGFFAGTAQEGSEGEFDDATVWLGVIGPIRSIKFVINSVLFILKVPPGAIYWEYKIYTIAYLIRPSSSFNRFSVGFRM